VLYAISAIEKRRPDGSSKLDYGRVVSKQGKPGKALGSPRRLWCGEGIIRLAREEH
jgi:hypothetical protein